MQGFTLVDGIVLAIIVVFAILAYARGLVRECAVDRRLDRRRRSPASPSRRWSRR